MAARVIRPRRPVLAAIVCTLAITIPVGCAGYRFGNNTLYAPNVRTVYVPMVQSEKIGRAHV